tara:strand:- start:1975 stop:2361 length:387 start_codon:yes stop_codon:yes gene_type:complete
MFAGNNTSTTIPIPTPTPEPVACGGTFDYLDCTPLALERQFLAAVVLALSCAVCALCGMVFIVAMQVKRLAEMLCTARVSAKPVSPAAEAKTALLPSVKTSLGAKNKKKASFEDTSCAPARDVDEEEL